MCRLDDTDIRVVVWRCLAALGLTAWLGLALAQASPVPDAAQSLRAQRDTFSQQLQHNVFSRPLVLVSSETSQCLRGDIYALMAILGTGSESGPRLY